MGQPVGTFKCVLCDHVWDGSELILDPMSTHEHWTCGDAFCGANVVKISNEPRQGGKHAAGADNG